MSGARKFLAALIAMEFVAGGFAWHWYSHRAILPPVDWSACLVENMVADKIRDLENRLKPNDPASWGELAAAYRTFGLFPQAEYSYRQIDRLAPTDRSYLYLWAESLDLMGRTQEASKLYRRIIDEKIAVPALGGRTTSYCWLNIGQDRLREENVPGAIDALLQGEEIPKAKFLLSRVLIRSGRAQEADILLDELLRDSPDMVEYNQMKAWAEEALGDSEAAQDYYERSLRSEHELYKWDPTYADVEKLRKSMGSHAWYDQALDLERQGKFAEALDLSHKAVASFWTEARAEQEARLEFRSGHYKEAVAIAEDAARRAGAYASTLEVVALAEVQLNHMDKAQAAWEQAAEIQPTRSIYEALARMRQRTGDTAGMRQYQALAQYQVGKDAWLTNGLTAARGYFEKSVGLYDGFATPWYYLGETRRFLGDTNGAETAYQNCLKINPDYGRAIRGLDRMHHTRG